MTAVDVYEDLRPLMFSIAYRMLGSAAEAEDVVQEAFLRFHRTSEGDGGEEIENPKAWLSAVTTRYPNGSRTLRASSRCTGRLSTTRMLGPSSEPAGSEEEASRELESLLRDSIRIRMIADVPLGVFFSGGIDSTAVLARARSVSTGRVTAFTVGFEESTANEAPHARRLAEHSWLATYLLGHVPWLCAHYLGVIRPPGDRPGHEAPH